jgi:hypothetical protein
MRLIDKRRHTIVLLALLVAGSACRASEVLDEKRATVLIKEALASETFTISPSSVAPLMSRSMNDYKAIAADEGSPAYMLGQLIKEVTVQGVLYRAADRRTV